MGLLISEEENNLIKTKKIPVLCFYEPGDAQKEAMSISHLIRYFACL